MVLVISILLLAVGAALVWGLDRSVSGVEGSTIGVILMALGGVGVLASLLSARAASGRRATEGWDADAVAAAEVEGTAEDSWPRRPGPPQRPPSP